MFVVAEVLGGFTEPLALFAGALGPVVQFLGVVAGTAIVPALALTGIMTAMVKPRLDCFRAGGTDGVWAGVLRSPASAGASGTGGGAVDQLARRTGSSVALLATGSTAAAVVEAAAFARARSSLSARAVSWRRWISPKVSRPWRR